MSTSRRLGKRLGYAATWAFVACLAFVRFGALIPMLSATPLVEGQRMAFDEVDFSRHDRTIVVVVSTRCRFCAANMDFYRTLAESEPVQAQRIGLVVAGWESSTALERYLHDHGVTVDRFARIPASRVQGTPTLLIVDRQGVIELARVGELARRAQEAIVAALVAESAGAAAVGPERRGPSD
jgi:hypothetical protein